MIDVLLLTIAKLLAGWLIADLIGGIMHWLEDCVLPEDLPVLGPYFIEPNRLHHSDPVAFLRGGFFGRNSTTWIVAGAVSLIWAAIFGPSLVWAGATAGGMVMTMVHALAHRAPPAESWIRALQDVGIIQSVRQHAQHHRPPSDRRYCILTDWLNPVLDWLNVWARLEGLLRLSTGRAG